ncbi:MAG TPA: diguanylate cyclase [Marinagarivorans sp.]
MSFKAPLSDAQVRQVGGINAMAQDPLGFIWFAGEVGLGRYDGHDLRVFVHEPENPHSLISSYIRTLKVDAEGTLWVATESGLCLYKSRKEAFDCDFSWPNKPPGGSSMQALALLDNGHAYIGGRSGLFYYSGERELRPVSFISQKADYRNSTVVDLLLDDAGYLWIATAFNGLFRYHPAQGVVRHFRAEMSEGVAPSQRSPLLSDRVKTLLLDSKRRLWVGTYGGGISVFSADGEHLLNYSQATHGEQGFTSDVIWDIYEDHTNTIWIAMDQGGVLRFDESKQRFIPERHRPHDSRSLVSDQARVVFEDKNNDIWVGTFDRGVSYFNNDKKLIQTYSHDPVVPSTLSHSSILALLQGTDGTLWVGTEDGLNAMDPNTGEFRRYTAANSGLPAKAVLSIAQIDDNTLWLGTWSGGLVAFDIPSGKVTLLNNGELPSVVASSRFVWDILKAEDGRLWIASELNGLIELAPDLSTAVHYQADETDPASLSHDFIWRVIERKNGAILLGTHGGLDEYLGPTTGFKHWLRYNHLKEAFSKRITALYEADDESIWVGTQDKGVFWLSPDGELIKHFGRRDGMPALTASAILSDQTGRVWVATINGLVLIDPTTLELSVFSQDNGLAGNNFNRNAFIHADDGYFYVGGAEGLNRFRPEQLQPRNAQFPVYVTGFSLLAKPVSPGEYPLESSTLFNPTIKLSYHDNMIGFSYTAVNYRDAANLTYSYKLQGFDDNWRSVSDSRSATYTNLPAGRYEFYVRARRRGGDWVMSTPIVLKTRAAPWLTPWAFLGYAIIFLILGGWIAKAINWRGQSLHYKRLSTLDPLTGVLNRLGIQLSVKTILQTSRQNEVTGMLVIDIDHFKEINDVYGHDKGDDILKQVVDVMQSNVRRSDVLGRWGGEEFLLVCPGVNAQTVQSLSEKTRQAIAQTHFSDLDDNLQVTVSIGATLFAPQEGFSQCFKRADEALYRAKKTGRNRTVYV